MKTRFLWMTLLVVVAGIASAQDLSLTWAKSIGSAALDDYQKTAVDSQGNIYVAGLFSQTTDFDPGPGLKTKVSQGGQDIYVLKLDKDGKLLWVHTFGNANSDVAQSILLTKGGNVIVAGYYSGLVDFNPGTAMNNLTSRDDYEGFMLSLTSNGAFNWVKPLQASAAGRTNLYNMVEDKDGNILVAGNFVGRIDFDPGKGTHILKSVGFTDAFVLKLNSVGSFKWVKQFGSTEREFNTEITTNGTDIYVAGQLQDSINFDPKVAGTTIDPKGTQDVYFLQLDSSGKLQWVKSIGSTGYETVNAITLDKNGNLYLVGYFNNTVDFDPGIKTYNVKAAPVSDGYILRLTSKGDFGWVKTLTSPNLVDIDAIALDTSSNIYLTGLFSDKTDFDPGPKNFDLTATGGFDAFLLKLKNTGDFVWAVGQGASQNDRGRTLHLDQKRGTTIFTSGSFYGTVDFDPESTKFNMTSNGISDTYFQKLKECKVKTSTQVVVACDSFTWINGLTYKFDNNFAKHTLIAQDGCDIVTLNLSFNRTGTDKVSACDSLEWIDGQTYYTSNNTAKHTLLNSKGCDSVVSLELSMAYSSVQKDIVLACDSFRWINGVTYYTNNTTAEAMLTSSQGCDSIVQLDLSFGAPDRTIQKETSCASSFTWINGKRYTSNSYGDSMVLANSFGCDSTVILDLTFASKFPKMDKVQACDSFTWINGITYKENNFSDQDTLVSSAGCDSIVRLQLTLNKSSFSTDNLQACDSYTWIDGNTYTTSNQDAVYTTTNQFGCDSTVALKLTVNTVDETLIVTDTSLEAVEDQAKYQWLDCEANYSKVANATAKIFMPDVSGEYALEVQKNNCTDTSLCYQVRSLGVKDMGQARFKMYPVPMTDHVKLDFPPTEIYTNLTVIDVNGKIVYTDPSTISGSYDLSFEGEPGVYIIKIQSDNEVFGVRILKTK